MNEFHRACVITGNWKMHKTVEEAKHFIKKLLESLTNQANRIQLAVPYTAIYPLCEEFKDAGIAIGAQNMNEAAEGSFTGEIAGVMLKEAGARFVLLGHSERRTIYHETNEMIRAKVERAIKDEIPFTLCIGETIEEHQADQTKQILELQLTEALKNLSANELQFLTLAYEPVWAIGSGNNATPFFAQDTHHFCRQMLASIVDEDFSHQVVIQYGGSVNASNAKELLMQEDVDGLLIGGASLSLESFLQIVNDDYSKI